MSSTTMGRREEMGADARSIRLTIPARPEYISLGRLALTAIAGLRQLSEETLHDLKLALTEACTNSVRHAYGEQSQGTVEIVYELQPDRLSVEVGDDGPGVAPEAPANAENADLAEGGLGIAIIRAVADEVEIGGRANGGSRLRFVKVLDD
jgi:serine/threonine-protein kinase RsbW